ncbi:CRISPR-associated endonuclease Cas3'' [Alienimonas californiensis]|uniref:HD Cas3-type domain-containing protein n=1 Tax=Alienimonas californiensis TaxID=2527989 RepID=A0A517PB50_9PLAN|nr:CRISPR-associated endonuclease Cas3'' [Alienimonas californiensis]QDT16603.1 hypothetical protein CA12_27090 [Alienimonas californiensis]
MYFSRSTNDRTKSDWEPLSDHLAAVAARAAGFADSYGAADWGEAAGRWHDLGKYSRDFQDHLVTPSQVDHATAGAQHAVRVLPGPVGRLLAYALAPGDVTRNGRPAAVRPRFGEPDDESNGPSAGRLLRPQH